MVLSCGSHLSAGLIHFLLFIGYSHAVNVAFIFAGSARSFVRPPVHLSLRYNLLEAFCPDSTCSRQVFIRMSVSDNTHISEQNTPIINAVGRVVPRTSEKLNAARRAFASLEQGDQAHLVISEIASDEEKAGMAQLVGNNTMMRIYKDLDPRRFNMYFNRWAAYQMALEFEKTTSIHFDCFVHARLDFIWGESMRPIHQWSMKRVWVPDQWGVDIPDTAAIIPRQFADAYYSLHAMYENKKVGCLGGPNFDPESVSESNLRSLQYNDEEIKLIQSLLCLTAFPEYFHFKNRVGVEWSWGGLSEVMLKRKFTQNGISLAKKTLGFSSIFTFMVRYPLEMRCAEQEPSSFIAWAQQFYSPSLALVFTCYAMYNEFGKIYNSNAALRGSSREMNCHKQENATGLCLIDKRLTEWNFHPHRILAYTGGVGNGSSDAVYSQQALDNDPKNPNIVDPVNTCLTITHDKKAISNVNYVQMKSCFTHTFVKTATGRETYRMHYNINQLFRVYVNAIVPQQIWNVHYDEPNRPYCLTVAAHKAVGGTPLYSVHKELCKAATEPSQLFTIRRMSQLIAPTESPAPVVQFVFEDRDAGKELCLRRQQPSGTGGSTLTLSACEAFELDTLFHVVRTVNNSPLNY